MKALAASLATAAVIVSAAYAGNVTPAQLGKLNARVNALSGQVAALERTTACLRKGWNAQKFEPYLVQSWGGFDTKSGNVSLYTAPSAADGIVGTGYLVESDVIGPGC